MRSTLRLGAVALLAFVDAAAGWHAWLGQEALPTVSGTNLDSSLGLPAMSPAVDPCEVALTSLQKIFGGTGACLLNQEGCSLACATAWGSFLRDVEHVTGRQCVALKTRLEVWGQAVNEEIIDTGFLGGVTSPVSVEEGGRLAGLCSGDVYRCPDNHCKRASTTLGEDGTSSNPTYSSLTPPAGECNGFQVVGKSGSGGCRAALGAQQGMLTMGTISARRQLLASLPHVELALSPLHG